MNVLGEMLALTVGKLAVLTVKGATGILELAAGAEILWRRLRGTGSSGCGGSGIPRTP